MLDQEREESKQAQQQLSDSLREEQRTLGGQLVDLKRSGSQMQAAAKMIAEQLKACQRSLRELQETDHEAELNNLQRKLIKEVVVELLTPIQRNMNVDLKSLRKVIEDQARQHRELRSQQTTTQRQVEEMNVTILRMLKNNDMDNALLNREINRMQEIDRLKVNHAKDVFYNPDTGSMLPSLDTCHASTSEGGPFLAHAPSHAATPPPHLLGGSTGPERL